MKTLLARSLLAASLLLLAAGIAPVLAQQDGEGQAYTIQADDSLWKLAEKYLGNGNLYPLIVEATASRAAADPSFARIDNPGLIFAGQKVWIPGATGLPAAIPAPAAPAVPAAAPGQPSGQIAFSFWNDHPDRCTYEIDVLNVPACLQGADQCQATRRVFPLNNVSEPALSPDGTRLAFRGWGEPPTPDSPFLNCAPAHPHRFLGNTTLDGTNFVGTGGFWEDSHPDWSPDGSRLIFDTERNGDDVTRILTINADGSDERNMFIAGQQPSFAPDGQRFVYRGCDLNGNRCGLWLATAFEPKSWEVGVNMIGPVLEADGVAHPDWSPTREEIVYQRNEGGNWNLWVVNADGSNNRRLTSGATLEGLPAWSPDGEWVAYVSYDGRNWSLRLVSRDGQTDLPLFTYDGGTYVVPKPVEPYGVRDWIDEQISWSR